MSETRTDVASTLVSTLFSLEPLSFDVAKAYETLDHIAACSECEDFIDALEDIIDTLRKTDGALEDVHKLRLINEVQFVALKVSRKSIRLQNREFEEYIEDIKKLNVQKFPTAPSPSKAKKRSRNKRATVSATPGTVGKKQRANELNRSGNTTPTPTAHEDSEAMERDSSSSDESSPETKNTKDTTPIVAENGARDSANGKGNLTYTEDEDFTLVSRKKKIASIFIDASQNTTELLNTLSNHRGNTLEGRFENGKLRVFPKTILEHQKLQSFLAAKKMRSHIFEMADNKQLKAVIRGLPTDFDQKEIATELKGFGFDPSHISILRNRKTNTNMPLFLVVLKRTEENKEIFHITNIGFFRVVIEPLNGSQMPPQCYRCQEFFHHSRLCNRAPKCLKCSGSHLTAECKKSTKSPAKCANCGGPYPAIYSGCPSNPVNKKQHKNKPNNNIWTEKAKVRAQKTTPQQQKPQSYASAVANNTPKKDSTFDANEIMQQMALMMTQWGTNCSATRKQ
ncbi:RNA-directed DNA polymerase from mobile element jockey [Trichonephila inaurata madagascariensis]|uniref:RNA-directed DNA polymerase from mobile element jockey n=1 Tax=Trichonephila inaurata madagascariensis TaxID=2747483 RepID=A0A8X6X4A5_9ARAC|nr:RNA-directed DNA polymerase from mobile element jockey [Trichonephila inaurata madagascariensis]